LTETIAVSVPDDAVPAEQGDYPYRAANAAADRWHLWHVLKRRLPIFLLAFLAVILAGFVYGWLSPRIYVANSAITILAQHGDPIQPSGLAPVDAQPSPDFVETQIVAIQSPQIATAVVRSLNLQRDPEFAAKGASDEQGQVAQATANLQRAVHVTRVAQTQVIRVSAESRSPIMAARIANEVANQYLLAINAVRESGANEQTLEVDSKLKELARDAQEADRNLQLYKISHGLMSAEGATMAEQETSNLNNQIAAARADLAEKEGRLSAARRQLASGGGGSDVTSALSSGTISSLRSQEAESSRNLAQLRQRYGPKHPQVAQEAQRLKDVQGQIQNELDRILSSLAAEVNVASSRLSSLLQSQGASRGRLASNGAAMVGLSELQRRADAAKTIYETFLNSSKGAEAREGLDQTPARVSSSAVSPLEPTFPNLTLVYALTFIFALVTGLVAVAVAEFLDARISTRSDVERDVGVRYLGIIPQLSSTLGGLRQTQSPQDYIVEHPMSAFAESIRNLRAAVTLRAHRAPKVIAVTSALPMEGKTTTALCIARTLAMAGATTVLVDCDLRRHSASDAMLDGRDGLLDQVLIGNVAVRDALLKDRSTDLQFLGMSRTPTDGRDLLAPKMLDILLAELQSQFEFVVLDTAPILGVADARSVCRHADATVLLSRWRRTTLRAASSAIDLLLAAQANVLGIALTQVDIRKFGSAEEDLYGYHRNFRGYYAN
jgi:capsular exopolysaccharide synthesis family protein